MEDRVKELYSDLTAKSLSLIKMNNIDLEDLAFSMGISNEKLMKLFDIKEKDFSMYLKMYMTLKNW